MELPAQIKTFLILVLTICSTSITTAQNQIDKDITFSHKGEKGFVKLYQFLGKFNFENPEN